MALKDLMSDEEERIRKLTKNYYLGEGNSEEEEEEESADDYDLYRRKAKQDLGYKPKKFAKSKNELRGDIIDMFNRVEKWSWEQIKYEMSDQPEAPLKAMIMELCDKVQFSGQGGRAEFTLKNQFKG